MPRSSESWKRFARDLWREISNRDLFHEDMAAEYQERIDAMEKR